MKKTDKKPKRPPRIAKSGDVVRDWRPLLAALEDVIDWALDIAGVLALPYPEDIDAIARVREFVHAWLEGRRAEIRLVDVLTAIATIFAALELETGIDSIELLAPIKTFLETPSRLPATLRCPGAARDTKLRIRRCPGHRNASAFIPQAA
jgi:hypothetical protein